MEQPTNDLPISVIRQWSEILGVPVAELIDEPNDSLNVSIGKRASLIKLMKTIRSIREHAMGKRVARLSEMAEQQLTAIMPELADVAPWHAVGQRRTLDDVGRTAINPIHVEHSLLSRIDATPSQH